MVRARFVGWVQAALARWRGLSPVFRFRLVLCLLAAGLAAWLTFSAEKPWTMDTASRAHWKLAEIISYYSFWAAVGNLIVLAALILSAGWWALPQPVRHHPPARSPAWFWPLLLAAMVFCGVAASMRMDFGFVHDEDYSARRVIAGSYKLQADGRFSLEQPKWTDTLYYYRKPNNHIFHSVLGRLCWTMWRTVASAGESHIKEWVIRTPAWIGGVGAVCMLAILLRRALSPLAGVLAAWLLALHPWHIRFAAEARGYSLLLCIIPIVLYSWLRGMQENKWRWWLCFAASQFALVYCYPGSAYLLVVLNGATAGSLLSQAIRRGECPATGRWFASNCFAAMAAIQLMLPLVPQLQSYLRTEEARVPVGLPWIVSAASHFLSGVPWSKSNLAVSPYPEMMPYAISHSIFFAGILIGILGLMVLGYGAMFRRPWPEGPIVAGTLLFPGFLGFAVAKLLQQSLFEWYLIYLLPGLIAGAAVGAADVGRWLATKSKQAWIAALPGISLVLAYGIFSQPFRGWFCTNPMEPVKEAVLAIRGTLDPNDQRQSQLLTGILLSLDDYYDPRARLIQNPKDFMNLLQTADQEGKPLYIMVSHPWAAAFNVPILWRLFNESGLFTGYSYFRGLDRTNDRVVANYQPGAAQSFNLENFLRGRKTIPNPDLPPLEFPKKPTIYSAAE